MEINELTQPKAKMSKMGGIMILLLFLGWMLGNFDRYVMSYSVISIAKDFGINATEKGLILSAFFLGYLIMQIPGGLLADKFGARKVLLAVVFVWSVFTGMTGAMTTLFGMLFVRFMFGIGEGPYTPSAGKMISMTFNPKQRGKATSLYLSSGGIAAIIAPIIAGYALISIGWRNLFFIIAGAGVIIILLFWIFLKNPTQAKKLDTAADGESAGSAAEKIHYGTIFKIPLIRNLMIANFACYTVVWGLQTWMPSYLVKTFNMNLTNIGWIQSIPGLASLIGLLCSGFIIDKLSDKQNKIAVSVMSALTSLALLLMFLGGLSVTSIVILETVISLMVGFITIYMPVVVYKKVPAEIVGGTCGTTNCAAQIGSFIAPIVMGIITDMSGGNIGSSFWFLLVMGVVLVVTLATLKFDISKYVPENA